MPRLPHHDVRGHAGTDVEEVILGVDTQKDVHVAAVISVLGVVLASAEFATNSVAGELPAVAGHLAPARR